MTQTTLRTTLSHVIATLDSLRIDGRPVIETDHHLAHHFEIAKTIARSEFTKPLHMREALHNLIDRVSRVKTSDGALLAQTHDDVKAAVLAARKALA